MIETQSAGGVVVNERGEIALVTNGMGGPWWGLPKGHLDDGEDTLTAAQREITEETGLTDLTLVKSLGSYKRYRGKPGGGYDTSELKHISMFLFRAPNTPLKPTDPNNPEARWVTVDEALAMVTLPEDRSFLASVMDEVKALK